MHLEDWTQEEKQMLCNCKNYAIKLCACKFHDEIPLTWRNAHRGFIYIAVENYDGGNGDMEVHTAHIRHQFQVSEDLQRKLHISGIRSNFKISPLSLVTVKSWFKCPTFKVALFPHARFEKQIQNWQVSDNQEKWLLPVGQSEKLKF